jgi:hypothetical protein
VTCWPRSRAALFGRATPPLFHGDGGATGPEFVGRGPMRAPGAGQFFGLQPGGVTGIAGPLARLIVPGRLVVGANLHGADARLARAIVSQSAYRGEERDDLCLLQEFLDVGGVEGGAIVALEHRRDAVLAEERLEQVAGRRGIGLFDRPDGISQRSGTRDAVRFQCSPCATRASCATLRHTQAACADHSRLQPN